ncbi:cyclic nucleotide-gated ion channel 1 [Quercus suber]|uniref:Cyclic nucleotide-gated ion channel 1 n=1 Tax=Quercus suber TaxID=58331 RepID=A0AAW0IGS7_QUESU
MACKNHGECVRNSFYYCDHNFRYQVYLDAHQSNILESKNIPQKIFYCFCWGMRNLRFAHIRLCTIPY